MNNANELSEVMSEILKQSGSGIEPRVTYIVSLHGRGTRPIVRSVRNTFANALRALKEYKSDSSDGQFVTFDVRVYNSMFDDKESLIEALDIDRKRNNDQIIRWHFCKDNDGDYPHVERPTDEDPLVHSMETCLVSYHFASSPCFRHQDVFIYKAFREGEPEWRHNDKWCTPIAESIVVDAWISLDEVYNYLWEPEEED